MGNFWKSHEKLATLFIEVLPKDIFLEEWRRHQIRKLQSFLFPWEVIKTHTEKKWLKREINWFRYYYLLKKVADWGLLNLTTIKKLNMMKRIRIFISLFFSISLKMMQTLYTNHHNWFHVINAAQRFWQLQVDFYRWF